MRDHQEIEGTPPPSADRWRIAGVLGMGTFVCYLDRVNLSIAASPLAHDLGFSDTQLGLVLSAFLWSYALAQVPVGLLVDRYGTRWPILVAIVFWAATSFATPAVQSLGAILLVRLLLGLAEAPMMPAFWRSITLWFPVSERGISNTLLDLGSKTSYVLGVPAMAWIVARNGWQGCFVLTGIVTVAYGALFFFFYRDPDVQVERKATSTSMLADIALLIGNRKVWGVALGFSAYVYVYYLLATWMPRLLQDQLNISVLRSGLYTAIPWAFAIACELVIGGIVVDRLVRRGHDAGTVRQWTLALSLICSLALLGATISHSTPIVLACLCLSAAGLAVATPTAGSLIGFIAPRGQIGTLGSIVNLIANAVGLCAPLATGWLVDVTGSFYGAGLAAAVVVVVGILSCTLLLGRVATIETGQP
jgi:ACS family D-galactonate transporter-like MFS transporter